MKDQNRNLGAKGVALVLVVVVGLIILTQYYTTNKINGKSVNSLFIIAQSNDDLTRLVENSIKNKKPVMIDYFANWCGYCKMLDRDVFTDPVVQQNMKAITAIRVDASDNSYEDAAMMKHYNVSGFPTIIILDRRGEIIPFESGFQDAEALIEVMQKMQQ